MSETTLATGSEKQVWITNYLKTYVRRSAFMPYIGRADTSIIIAKYELQEESGKTINIPLITTFSGNGVGGSAVLDGNEEALGNYNCPVSVDWVRNGTVVPKSSQYKTEIKLLDAGKSQLRNWSAEDLRKEIIYALMEVIPTGTTSVPYAEITYDAAGGGGWCVATGYTPGVTFARRIGVNWTAATEANKDAWLAANSDRVLFGAAKSNNSGNDHSASLANIDTTADKLSPAIGSLAKSMAEQAMPAIRPYQTEDGAEFFVMFCGPRSFRDLKLDATMIAANRDARERNVKTNPIFQDGDLIYDGVIYRKVPEIPHIKGVGNACDVEANFLCGQQALAIAWGQEPTPKSQMDKDYGFRPGVGIEELRGVRKLAFNGKQHGVVTVYTAAAADS